MESIGYAIGSADKVKDFIHAGIQATDNKVTNDQEVVESKEAKAKALSALQSTITLVKGTLAKIREVEKPEATGLKESLEAAGVLEQNPVSIENSGGAVPGTAKELVVAMSGTFKEDLGGQAASLEDMAKAIAPIVASFNDVLAKPYLDNFSATLETVPVVGLKDNRIMYLATKSDAISKTGTRDEWGDFSALSSGVPLDSTSNAVNDWPKMYLDQWEEIGDRALPTANLRSIIPYAVLATGRNQIDFRLLVLQHDGSIQLLESDDIYAYNSWHTISSKHGTESAQREPNWTHMAYWNDSIVAVDDQNNTWSLKVDFDQSVYTIGDKTPIEPTTELTATDIGPVAVQVNGYLYKRFVQEPSSDGKEPPLQWTRWVLTETLKSRYLDTQASLYPVVNTIRTFAKNLGEYLEFLQKTADDWAKAPDKKKKAIAIEAGKGFLLEAKAQEKALGKLQAAFWGSIAAMLLGIALSVVAVATGIGAVAVVASGALFVAGFVATVVLGVKIADLSREIGNTMGQIRVTNTDIEQLSSIVNSFTELDEYYGSLNLFWGRLSNDAESINDTDDAIAEFLGLSVFQPASIMTSKKITAQIEAAAQLYLDILNKQGVIIPRTLLSSSVLGTAPTPDELEAKLEDHIENGEAELVKGNLNNYYAHLEQAYVVVLRTGAIVAK
ncbi:hypothetical protein F4679DRAFT_596813 [Xylaria curta]|nr:hypothetical protein F4679DRAFT_596813 [Xylaria curta]